MYAAVPMIDAAHLRDLDGRAAMPAHEPRVEHLRETEIEHLDRAVGAHLDVRGFQIAVDDAAFVRGVERVGNLPRDLQRVGQRQTVARPRVRRWSSVSPVHELHDQRLPAARFSRPWIVAMFG